MMVQFWKRHFSDVFDFVANGLDVGGFYENVFISAGLSTIPALAYKLICIILLTSFDHLFHLLFHSQGQFKHTCMSLFLAVSAVWYCPAAGRPRTSPWLMLPVLPNQHICGGSPHVCVQ